MLKYLFNDSNNILTFNDYDKVLEYIPNNNLKIKDTKFDSSILISSINKFAILENTNKFIISLSGGVDSMVLISIIHHLGYEVIAIHINYNNRQETDLEQKFIEQWCKYNNIKLYTKVIESIKRINSKRSDYEFITKKIRFDLYKEIMHLEKINSIILAHHKDDIVENIFANVCRGRYILDLAVIKETSCTDNVTIKRPLINFYKSHIYEFAKTNQIPYFKDTTPLWSIRGKYRNKIYPVLEDTFSKNIKNNLLGLSRQSYEWNELINKKIIEPYINTIQYYETYVTFNVENYIDYPICFWNNIFMKIFYRFNKNCPSRKGIQTFINSINKTCYVSISNCCICYIDSYNVQINFKLMI